MKMSMTITTRCIKGCLLLRRGGSGLSPLVDARGSRLLAGDNWETLGGLLVLGGTIEDARWSGTAGSGEAAEFIRAAIGSGLRAGGGGAVLAGVRAAATCEGLGGGGGGARSGVVTFGLAGDLTGGEGFRMGTAGIGRDMEDAGFTGDCVRGRTGVSGGLSLRITSGGRRGGRGAELPILLFREGRLGAGGNAAVRSRVGGLGGGTEGLAGTAGGFDGGTLRAGRIGAEGLSDFGIDGSFPRVGGIAVM